MGSATIASWSAQKKSNAGDKTEAGYGTNLSAYVMGYFWVAKAE